MYIIVKKTISIFVVLFLSVFLLEAKVQAYQNVKVEGRQLLVDFDQDTIYEPFFVKGIGYSPYSVSRHPSDWGWTDSLDTRSDNIFDDLEILERDFTLLENMFANTVRIWKGNDTQIGSRFPNKMTMQTLDEAQQHGLKVVAGFWIDFAGGSECSVSGPAYYWDTNFFDLANGVIYPDIRSDILNRFQQYVSAFKDHPALLFWAIGNENNYFMDESRPDLIQDFYRLINEMAEIARTTEGVENYHPVAFVNGDINNIGLQEFGTRDIDLPFVDIWGSNIYRGQSFGSVFDEYILKTEKPLWVSEFGIDSWYYVDENTPENADLLSKCQSSSWTELVAQGGCEDQITQAQWDGLLWDEISLRSDVNIGATVMEYSDEWWKPSEWICVEPDGLGGCLTFNYETHDLYGVGPRDTDCDLVNDWNPPFPDKFFNEEWWGVVSIKKDIQNSFGADIVTPRLVYSTLQEKFRPPNLPPVITVSEDLIVFAGDVVNFNVTASDPDNDVLTVSAKLANGDSLDSMGAGFTDDGNGVGIFQWVAQGGMGGSVSVVFRVDDPGGLWEEKAVLITVNEKANIISPDPVSQGVVESSDLVFSWDSGQGLSGYWLYVGSVLGGSDIYSKRIDAETQTTVTGIPLDGKTLYVRLWSLGSSGQWRFNDYTYTTLEDQSMAVIPAQIINPVEGGDVDNAEFTFQWDSGQGLSAYWLQVGTSPGGTNVYFHRIEASTEATVSGISLNGKILYVRLWSLGNDGQWYFNDYTYIAQESPVVDIIPAQITNPVEGGDVDKAEFTFQWDSGQGLLAYWLQVGTSPGGTNVYFHRIEASTEATVSGISLNGKILYVRLWSLGNDGQWYFNDYTYIAQESSVDVITPAQITNPMNGDTIRISSYVFQWDSGQGVSSYWLQIGSYSGGANIYSKSIGSGTQVTVTGIPLNGNSLYARLWSLGVDGGWYFNDYIYTAE